jgi:histidyl-tRNA synthetase
MIVAMAEAQKGKAILKDMETGKQEGIELEKIGDVF